MRVSRICFHFLISGAAFFVLLGMGRSAVVGAARADQGLTQVEAHSVLETPVALNLEEIPLRAAVETLAREAGAKVTWDEAALAELDLSEETVAVHAPQKLALRRALSLILEPLQLICVNEGETLRITTRRNWNEQVITEVYSVEDLDAELAKLVQEQIAPGSWQTKTPGAAGYIALSEGRLEITHRRALHQEVLDLLTAFRAASAP